MEVSGKPSAYPSPKIKPSGRWELQAEYVLPFSFYYNYLNILIHFFTIYFCLKSDVVALFNAKYSLCLCYVFMLQSEHVFSHQFMSRNNFKSPHAYVTPPFQFSICLCHTTVSNLHMLMSRNSSKCNATVSSLHMFMSRNHFKFPWQPGRLHLAVPAAGLPVCRTSRVRMYLQTETHGVIFGRGKAFTL